MKPTFCTQLLCYWLAATVMLGSTGFGTVEHWCSMRGHSKSLWLAQKGCVTSCQATRPADEPVSTGLVIKKGPCCKTVITYQHLDVSHYVSEKVVSAALQSAVCIVNPRFRLLLAALWADQAISYFFPIADDPLPRPGRFRLIFDCIWLI